MLVQVFKEICKENSLKFTTLLGKQTKIPDGYDVVLFAHSQLDFCCIEEPFVGIHLIRDPRDVIVSGFLYHQCTEEKWCINIDFPSTSPILFPQVPYSQQHKTEDWKKNYLNSLCGKSYQQNLLDRTQAEALLFEIENYGSWTIEDMGAWLYDRKNILEVRFEDLMDSYDVVFEKIFKYVGFDGDMLNRAKNVAIRHDISRKSDSEIRNMKHVSSRRSKKWQQCFEEAHKEVFKSKFGDILIRLDYEINGDW